MSDMLQMAKAFYADWRRYGKDAKKHDAWIRKHARNRGWSVNPRWMIYTNLKLWISDAEAMHGRRYCPCYEPSGGLRARSQADLSLPVRPGRDRHDRLVPLHALRSRRPDRSRLQACRGSAHGRVPGHAHLERFAELRGMGCAVSEDDGEYRVRFG